MGATLHVRHTVEDYDNWKIGFDEHEANRRSHGATGHRLMRDGNDLTILLAFPDVESAKAFTADPSLRETMTKAGVIGAPELNFVTDVEEVSY
jgi:hypothetical protein